MKKNMFFAILTALIIAVSAGVAQAGSEHYEVDPVHSSFIFKVGHLGIAFVRGTFTDVSGMIMLDEKNAANSAVEITIKTESVDTNNEKRDEHLRTADFFHVEEYPEMSFKSTEVEKVDDNTVKVHGDFTLHGTTRQIIVEITKIGEGDDPWGGYRAGFEGEFTIDRSDYGMDKLIPSAGDRVDISLVVEAVKQ